MDADTVLRNQLRVLLSGGNAHMSFEDAVEDFPHEYMNTTAPNVTYTPWHLLEHLRRTQHDILEFIRDPDYESPAWPAGYWPAQYEKADEAAWKETLTGFRKDMKALINMADDRSLDLYTPLPHGSGQNILRELLLAADHNSYHIGEFAILRQVMQTWGPRHR